MMNIKMSQKRFIVISIALFVAILLLGIGKKYILPGFRRPTRSVSIQIGSSCNMVAKTLRFYYEELDGNVPENPVPGFVNLMSIDPLFSREAPVAPYTSKRDISFYLLLPRKLESSAPLLIAYTSPFTKNKGEVYRYALFLQGEEIVILLLREPILKGIVGKETFEEKIPDFYIWKRRSKYLRDQSDKGK
jgi:hypothetical protein